MRLRPARRRLLHHLALAVFVVTAGSAVALLLDSDRPVFLLSMGSAYASLALLALTLLLGPWNVVRHRPNPVSTHLRRDIGIWAGLMATVHVVMGLQVHMQGAVERYFLFPPGQGVILLRYDAFGLVNWMGLAAAVIALVLLAISNDLSLRRLGTARWKGIQRWNYAFFALVVVHGLGYQLTEGRPAPWVAAVAIAAALVVAGQAAGWRIRRRGST
ncbi:MAG: ferric reductase-like transmembrane domain-containing protein [Gemmatimonadota bacterium]|jgi:sulfoxide reductase heme-binding subunit YedZ